MRILLLTPPFTQINTPYPATPFLKRYLLEQGHQVLQADLGLEMILSLFSRKNLTAVFADLQGFEDEGDSRYSTFFRQPEAYIRTIDPVVRFLQNGDPTLANRIATENFLPKAHRHAELLDIDELFSPLSVQDKARYLATIYLEELSDFIRDHVNSQFGFSRYAEKIALAATDFNDIERNLLERDPLFDGLLEKALSACYNDFNPDLVAITIPFPGCLLSGLKSAHFLKKQNPELPVAIGGGYVTTELRELSTPEIFKYVDFITLDQGEKPLDLICRLIEGKISKADLLRTYLLEDGNVTFISNPNSEDEPFSKTGWPDYSDLKMDRYLSIIEIPNAMHRMWNDGCWNKMIIAQGCYWGKCAFCDVTLDYIHNYNAISAKELVDRIEAIIEQTGQTGFHFVDEAAPPKALKGLALELIKRELTISWWTNIRFEKSYNRDLCNLLAESGCIAVSGGLETVSDRLLTLMNKGISIDQAAQTLNHFQQAGIKVHTYLMYGFPTQTEQETIDSLETVRQLFDNNLVQSAFWHRFSLTAHSLISQSPESYKIAITGPEKGDFAWNDLNHSDHLGCNHDKFAKGLEKALYNYMFGVGLDYDLSFWFDFKIPPSTVSPSNINENLATVDDQNTDNPNKKLYWKGPLPFEKKSGNKKAKKVKLLFSANEGEYSFKLKPQEASWVISLLKRVDLMKTEGLSLSEVKQDFEAETHGDFASFQWGELWQFLRRRGLYCL